MNLIKFSRAAFALRKVPTTVSIRLLSPSPLSVNWISNSSSTKADAQQAQALDEHKKSYWRECATLLIARPTTSSIEFLLTQRAHHAKFMPGTWCFPGGVFSPVDSSKKWLKLFARFGQFDRLAKFKCLEEQARKPELYSSLENTGALSKEVAFRLTAIRETFEECGILLCAPASEPRLKATGNSFNTSSVVSLPEDQVLQWQARVKSNPDEFLTLCEDLEVLPCFDSLYEWSNWLTPTNFQPGRSGKPRRFDAIFYMTILPCTAQPSIHVDTGEVEGYKWCSAADLISGSTGDFFSLLPPQLSEMGALRNVTSIDELMKLILVRQQLGIRRWFTSQVLASDGIVGCMTGDDLLPDNVDIHNFEEMARIDKTLQQLEECSTNLHRWQFAHDGTYKSLVNTSEFQRIYPSGANMTVAHSRNFTETEFLRIFTNYTK